MKYISSENIKASLVKKFFNQISMRCAYLLHHTMYTRITASHRIPGLWLIKMTCGMTIRVFFCLLKSKSGHSQRAIYIRRLMLSESHKNGCLCKFGSLFWLIVEDVAIFQDIFGDVSVYWHEPERSFHEAKQVKYHKIK